MATTTLGQAGIDSYTETDEYGQPKTGTSARYGWLGTHQRDADTVGGLTLMGARLYNPTTGRFLSIDPVAGGNDNRYTYPADPINKFDLDGEFAWAVGLLFVPGLGQIIAGVAIGLVLAYAVHKAFEYYAYSKAKNSERVNEHRTGARASTNDRHTAQQGYGGKQNLPKNKNKGTRDKKVKNREKRNEKAKEIRAKENKRKQANAARRWNQ